MILNINDLTRHRPGTDMANEIPQMILNNVLKSAAS